MDEVVVSGYRRFAASYVDHAGVGKIAPGDAAGNRMASTRYLSGAPVTTSFMYNPVGELVAATDPNANAWVYTYDTLGRRLSADDPDLGLWAYEYDNGGRFGSNANQEYHTWRHVEEAGLDKGMVRQRILANLPEDLPEGLSVRVVRVKGTSMQYNAYRLSDGTIRVGRIYPLR